MAFVANSKINVDAWGKLGNSGWDWETLEPYYRKTYTMTLPDLEHREELGLDYVDPHVMGSSGPLHASFPDAAGDPLAAAWLKGLRELNLPMSTDPFTGNASGGYTNAATIHPVTKTRSYATTAYYEPAKYRSNLNVITGAEVDRIIFDRTDGTIKATGVQYRKDGEAYVTHARHEIVLCAGTFNSPKILELSGIGSPSVLTKHGIPLFFANEHVGENLQDHVLAGLSFEVRGGVQTKDDLMRRDTTALSAAMESYKTKQSGPFTVGGNYSSALLPLPDINSPSGRAEIEQLLKSIPPPVSSSYEQDSLDFVRHVLQTSTQASGGFFAYPAQADFKGSGAGQEVLRTKFPENYITIAVSLLHPLSRGSTHITAADPSAAPEIDPRYLTHPLDVEVLARHTRFIETIARSSPLAAILKPDGKRSPGVQPDLRQLPLEEVKTYICGAAKSTWHPTGTCSMMPIAKGGVVDSYLRVYGTKHLRVVDASIIPLITRGNTQTSVYAIAERAADLIKESLHIAK